MIRLIKRCPDGVLPRRPDGLDEVLWRLLCARGVRDAAAARAFLKPCAADLLPPEALPGLSKAAAELDGAARKRRRICVFGDYDVDGVCATAILVTALRALGADACFVLPSRHDEGYGLNEAAIRDIAGRCDVLVTVDCGITAAPLVELAQSLGLSVIVTDHHRLPERLPNCPVVSPLLPGSGNPNLCGAGVAFKLACALDPANASLVDLAALATVADVVSLTGENRTLVALGLGAMNEGLRPGLSALLEAADARGETLTARTLAFVLAPRLNAGGRLGSAERALSLLLADTPDAARPLADALNEDNTRRRALTEQIVRDAQNALEGFDFANRRVIVLADAAWNPGVIGLAASRLVEAHALPVVLFSERDGQLTGSCRSVPGVDIHAALVRVSDLLLRFGGHEQAAGLTMAADRLGTFSRRLDEAIAEASDPACFVPCAAYDLALPLDTVTDALVDALDVLEPTGQGNPSPVFLIEGRVTAARAIGRDGAHLMFTLQDGAAAEGARWWRNGHRAAALSGQNVRLLCTPVADAYRGVRRVQLDTRAALPGGDPSALSPDPEAARRLLHTFLMHMLYNKQLTPPLGVCAAPDLLEMDDALRANPRGTLIAVTDRGMLTELLRALPSDQYDLSLGAWPSDPRAFNALCFLPVGPYPEGYGRLYCPDAPKALFRPAEPGGGRCDWLADLPDLDALRALYRALCAVMRMPRALGGVADFARLLGEASGLSEIAAHAGLYALAAGGLIEFCPEPLRVLGKKPQKTDLTQAEVYRYLETLRAWGRVAE